MASVRRRKTYLWDKKKATRAKNPRTQDAIVAELEGYICPKCGKKGYPEVGELNITSGLIGRILNLQSERFTYIACRRCRFTEIYKTETSGLSNILDFLFGR